LSLEQRLDQRLHLDVLHTPLAEVMDEVARRSGVPLTVREAVATVDVSLLLPQVSVRDFLRTLETAYGLFVAPRPLAEGGGFLVGRGGPSTVTERLPLTYLAPERARLLFPDFLLPFLRVDAEHNALVVSAPPVLVERIRRDLALWDLPRPQVRVDAQVYEIADSNDYNLAVNAAYAGRERNFAVDTSISQVSVGVRENAVRALRATVNALAAKGRARLRAQPFSVVLSGEQGSLFLGQARYITVLRSRNGQQEAQALQLQIGYSLTVRPTVGASDEILLYLAPRVSTVDAIEAGSGLPVLGIREISSTHRIRTGDTLLVAGLDSDNNESFGRRILVSKRKSTTQTHLLVLVTARRV
jgi:hypothetical protein